MPLRLRPALAGLCAFLLTFPAAAQETRSVVILVRHAERAAEPADDPGLTPKGQARAEELAGVLADAGITAIYSTQYNRTRLTANAVARRLGLEVRVRPIASRTAETHSRDLADAILAAHAGQTVLVVGHSNTVPLLARALGAPDPGAITDDEYDNLVIVIVGPGTRRELIRARY